MHGLNALVRGLVGAMAFAATAQAADMPDDWPPRDEARPHYVELLSGWYLRGDVGYRWNKIGSVEGAIPTTSHSIGNSIGATLGAGYRYQWFRTDITIDRGSSSQFRADSALFRPQYRADIDTVSALMNFYVDFGTWGGFTPYVGAGAGATYIRASNYEDPSLAVTGRSREFDRTTFSWAWMAGVAFQIQPQWLIDVGFRHLDMGSVTMSASTRMPVPPTTSVRNLSADEVRVGLRFLFD
jgi:opacity protein-like surface antigen